MSQKTKYLILQGKIGSTCDGSQLIVGHVDGTFKGLGFRGAKRGCFAIGDQRFGRDARLPLDEV